MDVLVTCLRYPYPLENGENLRIFHYVRALRQRHRFDLFCLGDQPPPAEIRPLFHHIEAVSAPRFPDAPSSAFRRLAGAFSVEEVSPRIPALHDRLAKGLQSHRYDLIWTSADIFPSLPDSHGLPVLGDIVDDMTLQYRRELLTRKSGIDYLRGLKRLWLASAYERRYFGPADTCLFVSEVDAEAFSRVSPHTPVRVIHNGVDAEYFRPLDVPVTDDVLVFEGNMAFPPNTDAALYLCNEIFPLILARRPTARIILVGKNPPAEVQALSSERITVTGFVDDVRPYVAQAATFLCPLRSGAGIKNKILQAWAMGKAVVATRASTGGLRADDGQNILVRDDASEFADAAVALMNRATERERIGNAARTTIQKHYTWGAKARELETLMLELARHAEPTLHA